MNYDINDKIKLIPTDYRTNEANDFWHSFNRYMPYVLEMLPIVAYYSDGSRVIYANNCALQSINVPATKVIGKTPINYYPDKIAREAIKTAEYVFETKQRFDDFHYVTDYATGEQKTFKATLDPIFNPTTGNLMGLFGISIEINNKQLTPLDKLENNRRLAIINQDAKLLEMVDKLYTTITQGRIELFNSANGIENDNSFLPTGKVELDDDERDILYFLSYHKDIDEILHIFLVVKGRILTSKEVEKIICKQLYPKFNATSTPELLENAYRCGEIPFSKLS